MSGTAFGTVVVHTSPESAVGGPLSRVKTGDMIELDVKRRIIRVDIPDEEFAARIPAPGPPTAAKGYLKLVHEHMTQTDAGCDFDFMTDGRPPSLDTTADSIPIGWQGGW